jgi:hypothetical protein
MRTAGLNLSIYIREVNFVPVQNIPVHTHDQICCTYEYRIFLLVGHAAIHIIMLRQFSELKRAILPSVQSYTAVLPFFSFYLGSQGIFHTIFKNINEAKIGASYLH